MEAQAAEDARRRVNDEGAALRHFSSGASAEIERLRSERRTDEKALEDLRTENSCARDVMSRYRRVGREAEDEAKAENQARLAVEAKLKETEKAL